MIKTEKAYAKLNLFLDVISKRDDGFHNIKSIMHSLSLSDIVTLEYAPSDITEITLTIICDDDLSAGKENLVYKAAESFLRYYNLNAKIDILLEKHIPVSAGLGGGSSDAAATLRALNDITHAAKDIKDLVPIAAGIGSDVPYCLLGGTRLVSGRGEEISDVCAEFNAFFVTAIANEEISAKDAYAALDLQYGNFVTDFQHKKELDGAVEFIKSGAKTGFLYNIFEQVVLERFSGASNIKKSLETLGAKQTLVCGSGPSVFGVFDNKNDAIKARDSLFRAGYKAFLSTSV